MQKVSERLTPLLWAAVAVLALLAGLKTLQAGPFAGIAQAGVTSYCLPLLQLNSAAGSCGVPGLR